LYFASLSSVEHHFSNDSQIYTELYQEVICQGTLFLKDCVPFDVCITFQVATLVYNIRATDQLVALCFVRNRSDVCIRKHAFLNDTAVMAAGVVCTILLSYEWIIDSNLPTRKGWKRLLVNKLVSK